LYICIFEEGFVCPYRRSVYIKVDPVPVVVVIIFINGGKPLWQRRQQAARRNLVDRSHRPGEIAPVRRVPRIDQRRERIIPRKKMYGDISAAFIQPDKGPGRGVCGSAEHGR